MTMTTSWQIADGRIRVAAADQRDLPLAAGILDDASAWLESRGLTCWPRPFPVASLEADQARGATYLAWEGAVAVGTFSLYWTDVPFWGRRPDERPGYAGYLHKLAVRRGHPGLGRLLLDLAQTIAKAEGAAVLRLDCIAGKEDLRGYYEAAGFEYRGIVDHPDLLAPCSILEKRLA
jgi:hypothetical protein